MRRALTLASGMAAIWLTANIYVRLLRALHAALGPAFFDFFGGAGNVAMALLSAAILCGLSLAIGLLLRMAADRLERFLLWRAGA